MSALRVAAAGVCLAAALPVAAQDAARGRELYEVHCVGCHYVKVHQREPGRRLVKSPAELRAEVARRAAQTPHRLTVEDLEDIAAYLDRSHYRFGR